MANVVKRKKAWLLTVSLGQDMHGKYPRRTKSVPFEQCKTKKDAELEWARFKMEVEGQAYVAPDKMRFDAFVSEWRSKYGIKHLQPSTIQNYDFQLNSHIIPIFGHRRIQDIKTFHIVDFLDSLTQDGARKDGKSGGLSSTSVRYVHRVLKDIFERAVDWKLIKENPVASATRPSIAARKGSVYSEDDARRLFKALEKESVHWRLMISLALTTGLRRGELLALEWHHIDLNKRTLQVQQSLSYANGTVHIKPPKTKSSERTVSLTEWIVADLKEYHLHKKKERLQVGDAWKGGDRSFVFSNTFGEPFYHTVPTTWLKRFIERHKLEQLRFHDLRHTSATLLINQGVHAKTIQARLGHASFRTTMDIYGHSLQVADQAAADTFDMFDKRKA